MNRGILKCALSFVITIVLVLGMIPMGDANVVEAAGVLEIKASELDSCAYYSTTSTGWKELKLNNGIDADFTKKYYKVNLIMDEDIEIDQIESGVDLTISKSKTLCLRYIDCDQSIRLEKDANIKLTGLDGQIYSSSIIYSEANISVGSGRGITGGIRACDRIYIGGGSIECDDSDYLLKCDHGNISVENANINVNDTSCAFYSNGNLSVSGSEIKIALCTTFVKCSEGDLSIDNSNISCNDLTHGITAKNISIDNSNISCNDLTYGITAKNISVNGGNSSFSINDNEEASENVFFSESFNFNGGTLSLTSTKSPIKTPENGIKLGERCYVSTPEGGSIQSNGAYDFVADADGNEANTVVLSERAVSNGGDNGGSNGGGDNSGGNNSGNDGGSGNAGGNNSGNDGSNNGNSGNDSGSNSGNDGGAGNAGGNNSGNNNSAGNAGNEGNTDNTQKYCNEWVDGRWYNADGVCDYEGILSWKCNSTGWWVEDTLGWYPQSQWQKIDGKWYYFLDTGYMDYSEYRDGYWLGSDGAWVEDYYGGHWCCDSTGWWYEDSSGWYPTSQWLWIDGKCYYFEADGYLATNKYIDGYWVGSDGAY